MGVGVGVRDEEAEPKIARGVDCDIGRGDTEVVDEYGGRCRGFEGREVEETFAEDGSSKVEEEEFESSEEWEGRGI